MKNSVLMFLVLFCLNAVNAQTPGALITSYSPIAPLTLINPDGNSWVTTSASAYVTDDQTESEISWVVTNG